jgi:hypothetical protein
VFRLFSCIQYERSVRFRVGLRLKYSHPADTPLSFTSSLPIPTFIDIQHSRTTFNLTISQHYISQTTYPIIMPIPFWKPRPAPPGALQAARQPLLTGNPLSQLFLQWLNPLLKIGYSRPLQIEGQSIWYTCMLMKQISGQSRNTWNVEKYVSTHGISGSC